MSANKKPTEKSQQVSSLYFRWRRRRRGDVAPSNCADVDRRGSSRGRRVPELQTTFRSGSGSDDENIMGRFLCEGEEEEDEEGGSSQTTDKSGEGEVGGD